MDAFVTFVWRISRVCGVISAALLLAAVLAVCHLVFVRYVLNQSAIWQHEFVTFSVIAATFIGSPYVLLKRGHVNVDLLPHYLGERGRFFLALFASGASLAFCAFIAVYGFTFWHEAWVNDWRAETVWAPPLWVPYASVPIGMGLMSLQYVADIVAIVLGRDMPFGAHDPSELAEERSETGGWA
ncbi:TRAP transporter small permease [Ferruginivarius sediminum]|uniref:TRAP transporter small permease protein n=1 Tax=Ferruginivarius sediminum TaxID=2661937 RepID=A0A369T6X3_9PROT|nr:TRAP transporter small permease [Ferruginivarius sediminum]RDD60632.1 TRAP transporter small permease [Ferruginivarius sediminum]